MAVFSSFSAHSVSHPFSMALIIICISGEHTVDAARPKAQEATKATRTKVFILSVLVETEVYIEQTDVN